MNFQCRALLFDMDGVLVDSTAHVDAVWREWAREKGVDEDRVMEIAHGRTTAAVLAAVAPEFATPEEVADLEGRDAQDDARVTTVDGASELLGILPERSWAIVTSASAPLARRRIARAGLPEPSVLVSADDVREGKPSPEGYLAAARRLGRRPADCIVFEDALPRHRRGARRRNARGRRRDNVCGRRTLPCRRRHRVTGTRRGRSEKRAPALASRAGEMTSDGLPDAPPTQCLPSCALPRESLDTWGLSAICP